MTALGGIVTRVLEYGRRSRPAPRPLSPALDAFVDSLAATPYQWSLRSDGRLRTREQGMEFCPITGVVRYQRGWTYSVGDFIRAGESIGLSSMEAALIVDAADGRAPSALVELLRRRLLTASRVSPPRRRRDLGAPHDGRQVGVTRPELRDISTTCCDDASEGIVLAHG